jgi:hypothetical protein
VEAGARVLAGCWDDLPREDQAALIALDGPVVEAALAVVDRGQVVPEYGPPVRLADVRAALGGRSASGAKGDA